MNAVRETLLKNVRDFVEKHERDSVANAVQITALEYIREINSRFIREIK
jgi:hypothetical protein